MGTYSILTISGRGLPVTVDADGYDTYLAASEMAAAEHDGEYAIVAEDEVPPCAASMGCLCAGHARGAPPSSACDTTE